MVAKMVEHVSPVQLQHKLLDLSIRTVEPCQMINLCTPYSEDLWLKKRVSLRKVALMRTLIRNRIVTNENSPLSILDGVLVEHNMLVSKP